MCAIRIVTITGTQIPGQGCNSHSMVFIADPSHSFPPLRAILITDLRAVLVPGPQDAEQSVQLP